MAHATEPDSVEDEASESLPESTSPNIDQTDRNDVLATIREAFSKGDLRDRDQAIRDVAYALGYRRLGSRIHDVLSRDIQTAVRRGILDNSGGQHSLLCSYIDRYTRAHLIDTLLSAMGGTWQTRDEAIITAARHLDFRRTGRNIKTAFKSAINGALRRGLLERDGPNNVRKAR